MRPDRKKALQRLFVGIGKLEGTLRAWSRMEDVTIAEAGRMSNAAEHLNQAWHLLLPDTEK